MSERDKFEAFYLRFAGPAPIDTVEELQLKIQELKASLVDARQHLDDIIKYEANKRAALHAWHECVGHRGDSK